MRWVSHGASPASSRSELGRAAIVRGGEWTSTSSSIVSCAVSSLGMGKTLGAMCRPGCGDRRLRSPRVASTQGIAEIVNTAVRTTRAILAEKPTGSARIRPATGVPQCGHRGDRERQPGRAIVVSSSRTIGSRPAPGVAADDRGRQADDARHHGHGRPDVEREPRARADRRRRVGERRRLRQHGSVRSCARWGSEGAAAVGAGVVAAGRRVSAARGSSPSAQPPSTWPGCAVPQSPKRRSLLSGRAHASLRRGLRRDGLRRDALAARGADLERAGQIELLRHLLQRR